MTLKQGMFWRFSAGIITVCAVMLFGLASCKSSRHLKSNSPQEPVNNSPKGAGDNSGGGDSSSGDSSGGSSTVPAGPPSIDSLDATTNVIGGNTIETIRANVGGDGKFDYIEFSICSASADCSAVPPQESSIASMSFPEAPAGADRVMARACFRDPTYGCGASITESFTQAAVVDAALQAQMIAEKQAAAKILDTSKGIVGTASDYVDSPSGKGTDFKKAMDDIKQLGPDATNNLLSQSGQPPTLDPGAGTGTDAGTSAGAGTGAGTDAGMGTQAPSPAASGGGSSNAANIALIAIGSTFAAGGSAAALAALALTKQKEREFGQAAQELTDAIDQKQKNIEEEVAKFNKAQVQLAAAEASYQGRLNSLESLRDDDIHAREQAIAANKALIEQEDKRLRDLEKHIRLFNVDEQFWKKTQHDLTALSERQRALEAEKTALETSEDSKKLDEKIKAWEKKRAEKEDLWKKGSGDYHSFVKDRDEKIKKLNDENNFGRELVNLERELKTTRVVLQYNGGEKLTLITADNETIIYDLKNENFVFKDYSIKQKEYFLKQAEIYLSTYSDLSRLYTEKSAALCARKSETLAPQ